MARAIPLRNLPFYDAKDELELEQLLSGLRLEWHPQGPSEEMLVEQIACIYILFSHLYRFQTAVATIAMNKELCVPTVEESDVMNQSRNADKLRDHLVHVLNLAREVLVTNSSLGAGFIQAIHSCILSRERRYALQHLYEAINKRAAAVGASANKRDWMDELRTEFLEILTLAVDESFDEIQASELRSNQLAIARFEQHLLPDEEAFRKIVRYRPMLDRELHRCLDRLEHLQKERRANGFRGSEAA